MKVSELNARQLKTRKGHDVCPPLDSEEWQANVVEDERDQL